ncbi:cupin-like domain-containing protein [Streptomyces sp. NPDC053431]|uniref:cupin-like domain-containing protein n=1 Tax=Streptomyces sp. NPDC053431 TaxID=3365703 RepID=UPI0037D942DA
MTYSSTVNSLPGTTGTPKLYRDRTTPAVFRGAALHWPAVQQWTFNRIGALAPDLPVNLVVGNREKDPTQFTASTLGRYTDRLARRSSPQESGLYLKEFDLLTQFPDLRHELRQNELFPRWSITSSSAWMGPAGARTGLHHDFLDNFAVVISGKKRFLLAERGSVEMLGKVSDKYDSWARLSFVSFEEIVHSRSPFQLFTVDLMPGDVLFVPAFWWHEVVNLSPSILLSGFFGSSPRVAVKWATVKTRDAMHYTGLIGRGHCTCHGHRPCHGRNGAPPVHGKAV